MKKTDAHSPCKRRRMVSGDGSSALSSGVIAAVVQLPSNAKGDTLANAITCDDSSDDSSGGASVSKVNNNEIVSFYLLLFSCMYMDV